MKLIPLTQGREAIVDDQLHDAIVAAGPWRYNASSRNPDRGGHARSSSTGEYMHRLVWRLSGRAPVPELDHGDRNKLNNQIANLRPASDSQQRANQLPRGDSPKGVFLLPSGNFMASTKFQGKSKYIGAFETATEAALAYDTEALKLFGEFAYLNFPEATDDNQTITTDAGLPALSTRHQAMGEEGQGEDGILRTLGRP